MANRNWFLRPPNHTVYSLPVHSLPKTHDPAEPTNTYNTGQKSISRMNTFATHSDMHAYYLSLAQPNRVSNTNLILNISYYAHFGLHIPFNTTLARRNPPQFNNTYHNKKDSTRKKYGLRDNCRKLMAIRLIFVEVKTTKIKSVFFVHFASQNQLPSYNSQINSINKTTVTSIKNRKEQHECDLGHPPITQTFQLPL